MTAVNEDLLSQYFDGELAGDEAEVVRRALDEDESLRAKLDGLEHLRAMMRTAAEARADDVDADALFAAVEARLDDDVVDDEPMFPEAAPPEPAARPKLAVVPGGKQDAPKPAERPAAETPPSRTGLWIGIGATVAAAAALLIWILQPGDRVQPGVPTATGGGDDVVAEAAPPPGSEIEEVDFGYSTGAIFSVEGTEGEQYAVVWISDEKPELDVESEERIQ